MWLQRKTEKDSPGLALFFIGINGTKKSRANALLLVYLGFLIHLQIWIPFFSRMLSSRTLGSNFSLYSLPSC